MYFVFRISRLLGNMMQLFGLIEETAPRNSDYKYTTKAQSLSQDE